MDEDETHRRRTPLPFIPSLAAVKPCQADSAADRRWQMQMTGVVMDTEGPLTTWLFAS
jgi:hypothetical protein